MKNIIIGTRGSKLSLIQTEIVLKQIQAVMPSQTITIEVITTKGDKDMSSVPLDSIGKGWFTKEIDNQLLLGKIDIAVHSLKDLPEVLPTGLMIAAIPQREDAREALVSRGSFTFNQLPVGAIIGTDSSRRKAQILHKRHDLNVNSVRGNVMTRLEKLDNGPYDGLFLAVAGLKRLGLENRISEYFSITDVIPSPGQGALAVVIKKTNKVLLSLFEKLNDAATVTAVNAERVFSKTVGGGCKMPVGAYAECKNNIFTICGVIASLDGQKLVTDKISGPVSEAEILAIKLAEKLLQESEPWYKAS
jgi:hydroxymethylbilane synthase